jgi:hypothetical protein
MELPTYGQLQKMTYNAEDITLYRTSPQSPQATLRLGRPCSAINTSRPETVVPFLARRDTVTVE